MPVDRGSTERQVEIPGFRIQREVGRGAASIVYLATWGEIGRDVALKVAVGDTVRHPERRRRFLREAGLVADIDHPHVVKVYDAGTLPYIAMEYLEGGNLIARMGRGMSVLEAVGVAKQIAVALDILHDHGIVHRDVKPENILFRGRNEAVLTDFGIAVEAGGTPSPGEIVGTTPYMSPEQAAGVVVDGRSDLYSLGVVFHLMLTGEVPFSSADGVPASAGAVPRLPDSFSAYQDVLDRWLRQDPAERFQTGADLIRGLDAVPGARGRPSQEGVRGCPSQEGARGRPSQEGARDSMPMPPTRISPVSTDEVRAVADSAFAATNIRAEGSGAPRRSSRASVAFAWLALAAVAVAGYFGFDQRATITDFLVRTGMMEDVSATAAWKVAEALRLDPNQSLAAIVAAYRRVLDGDPEHPGALERLSTVAAAWKSDIGIALASDDLALAEAKLNESLGVFPQDAELTVLFERLSDRRRADSIMQNTNALLASQGMSHEPSASSAIQAYQEVLQRLPEHAEAQMRLDELAGHYTGLAVRAVLEGDVAGAMDKLGRAVAANPDHPALDNVRARINQAATLQAEIDELLNRASGYRAASALVDPPEANAAEIYHRVLATDRENAIAGQGLLEVAASVLEQFGEHLDAGNFEAAKHLADRSSVVGLGEVPVNEMRTRYDAEIVRLDTVARLLAEARALFSDGWFTLPADGGVVARVREVLRLDPGNTAATELLTRTAERLAAAAKEAHEHGLVEPARLYLDLALTVTPDVDEWRDLREAWAANALIGGE